MPVSDPERHAHRLAKYGWLLAVGGAVAGGWVGTPIAFSGVFLLLFACYSARDGFLLCGPIAAAECNRSARKGRPWVWRVVYALAAGGIVIGNMNTYGGFDALVPRHQLAYISEQVGNWFAVCLFLYVSVLSLQVFGTSIPDDRTARRWDVLRTTDLRSREIVFGKFVGKLPVLLEPLFTATPILTLLPLFGGISPWFPVAVLACCSAVTAGLGGVALFYSVFAKTSRQAIGWTAVMVVVYLLLSGFVYVQSVRLTKTGVGGMLGRIAEAVSGGNPYLLFQFLRDSSANEDQMLAAVGRFVLFQLAAGLVFALVAVRRLPRGEAWDFSVEETKTRRITTPTPEKPKEVPDRPPMTDSPIIWWERFGWLSKRQGEFVRDFRPKRLAQFAAVWGVACVTVAVGRLIDPQIKLWSSIDDVAGGITLVVFTVCGFVFVFPPLFRAARCVARERAADTLEPLLLTPLTPREILFQKWAGVMLCDWPLMQILLALAVPAMLTGVVSFAGGLLYFIGVVAMAGTATAVGLAVSVRVPTPTRAVVVVGVLAVLVVFATSGLINSFHYKDRRYISAILLPPSASASYLVVETSPKGQPMPTREFEPLQLLACFVMGLGMWVAMGFAGWQLAGAKFDEERSPTAAEPPA